MRTLATLLAIPARAHSVPAASPSTPRTITRPGAGRASESGVW